MNISKLNLAYTHDDGRVGRTPCVKLFFSGFGQNVHCFEYLLNYTINSLIDSHDPWIMEDLKNCPDIYMISAYEESDHLRPQVQTNSPLDHLSRGFTIDNSSLEVLSLSGVEITVNGSVPASPANLFDPYYNSTHSDSSMALLQRIIDAYEQVEVLAWSFGVRAARSILERLELPEDKLTFATAIAGTIAAVDANYGIDPRVYSLTLKRLNAQTFKMFQRNMCLPTKGREDELRMAQQVYALLSSVTPELSSIEQVEQLKRELMCLPRFPLTKAFDTAIFSDVPDNDPLGIRQGLPKLIYNQALICENDAIFNPKAQINYWQSYKDELTCLGIKNFEALQFSMPHLFPQAILNALTAAPHTKRK